MAKCSWRDKQGGPETCKLLAQDCSEYCPRHTFLFNLREKESWAKEEVRRQRAAETGITKLGTRTRLEHCAAGYVFQGSDTCRCGKLIEWWRTPKLRNAPYDPMPEQNSHAVSHFSTCKRAGYFRRPS